MTDQERLEALVARKEELIAALAGADQQIQELQEKLKAWKVRVTDQGMTISVGATQISLGYPGSPETVVLDQRELFPEHTLELTSDQVVQLVKDTYRKFKYQPPETANDPLIKNIKTWNPWEKEEPVVNVVYKLPSELRPQFEYLLKHSRPAYGRPYATVDSTSSVRDISCETTYLHKLGRAPKLSENVADLLREMKEKGVE